MATSRRGAGLVGYNVQTAVDAKNHLIFAHEVTNASSDRSALHAMAQHAREATELQDIEVVADRRFGKQDFVDVPERNGYRSPAGESLILPLHPSRSGIDHACVLEFKLPEMRDSLAVQHPYVSTRTALGA